MKARRQVGGAVRKAGFLARAPAGLDRFHRTLRLKQPNLGAQHRMGAGLDARGEVEERRPPEPKHGSSAA